MSSLPGPTTSPLGPPPPTTMRCARTVAVEPSVTARGGIARNRQATHGCSSPSGRDMHPCRCAARMRGGVGPFVVDTPSRVLPPRAAERRRVTDTTGFGGALWVPGYGPGRGLVPGLRRARPRWRVHRLRLHRRGDLPAGSGNRDLSAHQGRSRRSKVRPSRAAAADDTWHRRARRAVDDRERGRGLPAAPGRCLARSLRLGDGPGWAQAQLDQCRVLLLAAFARDVSSDPARYEHDADPAGAAPADPERATGPARELPACLATLLPPV